MQKMTFRIWLSVLALACVWFAASASAAGECAADGDCPEGFSCQAVGGSACAEPADPNTEPAPCEPETYYACVPPPPPQCSSDADCTDNQVCVTYQYEACSGGGSTSGSSSGSEPLPPEEDTECTAQSESYCVPRYFAPCEADADCGPGFSCVQDTYTVCSGGSAPDSSGGSSSGSEPPPPDQGTCETQTSDTKYCQIQEIDCLDGQSCPEGLTCETYESGGTSSSGMDCPVDPSNPDGCTPIEPDPTPPQTIARCVPPEWSYWFGSPDATTQGGGTSSGSESGNPYNDAVGGSVGRDDLSTEGSSSGGGTSGGTSGSTSGSTSGATGGNADGGDDDGGCQMVSARTSTQTPWAILALGLGLLLTRRARRDRAA